MSQVKKLQAGGKFIIDGQEINGNDAINAVRSYLGETTGGIMNALREGQTVDYNSADNTISITNNEGQSLTNDYLPAGEKASVMDSKFKKDWGATFHTKTDQFKRDLLKLRGVVAKQSTATDNNNNLTQLRKGSGWFYTKDKDGKDIFEEGPLNTDRLAMLNEFRRYIEHFGDNGEEESKKLYKTDGWSADNLRILQNTFAGIKDPEARDAYWKGLIDKIKGNSLENTDKELLRLMGFDDSATETNTVIPIDRTKWTNAGFGGLVDLLGQKAHINDDGSLSLNDGESWGWNLGDLSGRNIWFNDDFYNSQYGADGSFDPFKGLTLYNNRLYALDNPTLSRILNAEGGFNSLKKAGNWTGADNVILTRFTSPTLENPAFLDSDSYSTFLSKNPSYRFSDLTGLVTTQDMDKDDQIIQYVDLNDNTLVGPYQNYQYKYALLDNRGTLKRELTPEELIDIENGSARETGLNTYKRISGNSNQAYNNRYYEDILDNNREATGFRFYRDIDNPNTDVILHMPEINASNSEGKDIKLPKEIAEVLMNNNSWIDYVVGNAQNKKNFTDWVSSLVQSWWANSDHGLFFHAGDKRKLRNMGFSEDEIQKLQSSLKESRKGNRAERRGRYLVNAPILQKNGGVLKYQTGGRAGGAKISTGVTEKQLSVKNTNPKNAAGITEIGGNNWTNADTLELGALAADLGSLVLALTPGTNVASAAVGAGSSTARLAADRQRGTKGAGWNYVLNLGMDAATLLPLLGAGAKGVKTVKAVKNALPTIIKAASVYGLGSAVVNSAKKIANGEKWTVRDVSTLVNGLTAGVGIARQGGLGKSTKTTKIKGYSESFKVGDTDVTLNNEQITNIMKSKDQAAALKDAITKQAKGASKEEINTALDKLLKSKQTIWQRVRRKEGDVVLDVKKKINTSTEQLESTGRPLYDWWHGLGDNRAAYNARITGDRQAWKKANLTKTPGGQKSIQTYWDGKTWHVVKQTTKQVPIAGTESFPSNWATGSGPIWPTQQITRTTLNPTMSTRTVTRKGGVKFNRNRYNLYDSQSIVLPQWINPFTRSNNQRYIDIQPSGLVYQPIYKKGGKVIKAQNGSATDWWKSYLGSNEGKSWLNSFGKIETLTPAVITAEKPQTKVVSQQSNTDQQKKDITGGLPGEGYKINYPNLDDTIRAGITARAIYHDRDLQRKSLGELYKRQFQTPQADRAKYNFSDIEQGYNEARNPYLESRFVTSDSRDSMAFKLNKAQQLSSLAGQKNSQITQRKTQIDDMNRQIDATNEQARVQTANEKSQYLTNLNYQNRMLDSVTWNRLFSDVINPFGQQMSQQGRDAFNKNAQLQYQLDVQAAQREENARVNGELQRQYGTKWAGLSNADKQRYGSLEEYAYTIDPEGYKTIVKNNSIYNDLMTSAMRKYTNMTGAGLFYKSGGTINIRNTNKNLRSAQEQIAINSAKSAKRSVDELSKALFKMLAELTK